MNVGMYIFSFWEHIKISIVADYIINFYDYLFRKKWLLDICSSYIHTSNLLITLFKSSIFLTICHVIVHFCVKCVTLSLWTCFYWIFLYIFWSMFWCTKVHDYHFSWWIGNFMKVKGLIHLMFCYLLILIYILSF